MATLKHVTLQITRAETLIDLFTNMKYTRKFKSQL